MNAITLNYQFAGARPYRLDSDQYATLIESGVWGDRHVELIQGELIEMAPAQLPHGRMVIRLSYELCGAYERGTTFVCTDTILRLGADTVRAPDIAVVDQDVGERKILLPEDILLAIEVSDSTLAEDLGRKRLDYAAAGIRHYWVVDVEGCQVHRFASPVDGDYDPAVVSTFSEPLPLPESAVSITIS